MTGHVTAMRVSVSCLCVGGQPGRPAAPVYLYWSTPPAHLSPRPRHDLAPPGWALIRAFGPRLADTLVVTAIDPQTVRIEMP